MAPEPVRGLTSTAALLVAGLTAIGFALRLSVLHQSLFGDELATYWDVTTHSLWGVLRTVHGDAEITPPLYFVLAKLATFIDVSPEMLRLPSLLAGTATIPMTYLLGARTLGRRPAVVGATLVALSPFLIYYSSEARGYQVMIALLLASTLALLRGVEGGGLRWWIAYAAFSCAAMYTHYTVAFALAAQAGWALWAHPCARRGVLLANLGAALAFAPWASGFIADLNSPTTDILSLLQPFNLHGIRISLEHWSIGYPYADIAGTGGVTTVGIPLSQLPGYLAIALLGVGVALALGAMLHGWIRSAAGVSVRIDRRLALILALAVATPMGEAMVSAISTNLLGTRNLAAAWPASALLLGALLTSSPRRTVWVGATTLAVTAFAIGAVKMLGESAARPDFDGPARAIEAQASPSDIVIEQVYGPGPLSPLDTDLGHRYRIIRVGVPQERDHPFTIFDPVATPSQIVQETVSESRPGSRVLIVGSHRAPNWQMVSETLGRLRPRFRLAKRSVYGGLYPVELLVLEARKQTKHTARRG